MKSDIIKKWYLQFWALSLAIFSLSLLFFLLPVDQASATDGETFKGTNNFLGTVNSGVNQILVCNALFPSGSSSVGLSWNGVSMIQLDNFWSDWGANGGAVSFYLVNPDLGTNYILTTSATPSTAVICSVWENVNQVTPIGNHIFQNTGTGNPSVTITKSDSANHEIIMAGYASTAGVIVSWPWLDNENNPSNKYALMSSSGDTSGSSTATISFTSAFYYDINLIELNYFTPPPTTYDYVQYNYSTGPAKITGFYPTLDPLNWSIHYNVCDTGFPPTGGYLLFTIYQGLYDITVNGGVKVYPTTCQGDFNYDGLADTGSYGTSTVYIVMNTIDATGTSIQGQDSSTFTVTQIPHIIDSIGNINYRGPNPYIINTGSASGTVAIPFDYNVCGQPGWATDHFALENLNTNTITSFTASTTSCTGSSTISIPYVQNFVDSFNARIELNTSTSTRQILGNSFVISWQLSGTSTPTTACVVPEYDIVTLCPDYMKSTSTSIFNFDSITCGISTAGFYFAKWFIYPSCSSLYSITGSYDKFKHAFPFNAYYDLTGTVDTAINSALISTSTKNSISIPFIRKTATSSQYYMLPVMTSTTISHTIGATNYGTVQNTLAYVWWIIVAFVVFMILYFGQNK